MQKKKKKLDRNDDIGVFKSTPEPEVDRKKKELNNIFKNNGLSINVKTSIKTADFLDIHFNLVKVIYHPMVTLYC